MKIRDFSPVSKLKQFLLSILAGCETLTAFNRQLDGEVGLAAIWNSSYLFKRFDSVPLGLLDPLGEKVERLLFMICKGTHKI